MFLKNTKPLWAPQSVATESGWQDPVTKEIYVSVPRLLTRMAEEERVWKIKNPEAVVASIATEIESSAIPVEVVEVQTPEIVIKSEESEPKMIEEVKEEVAEVKPAKKAGRPRKVVSEVVEQNPSVQVIGEVVESNLNVQVIGE